MKNSDEKDKLLDLERDLPTTPEDVVALRRFRDFPRLDLPGYLLFLASFPPPSHEKLRSRKGPRGGSPFTLDE
jgi:hypothetical protein